jgi:hypothetical protein
LILSGIVLIGLGIGIWLHDITDFMDLITGKKYKHPEDKGKVYKKVKMYG